MTTGKVVEYESGKFNAPNVPSYNLVSSGNFVLIDGGFGYLYILKYDATKKSSSQKDPNRQLWRIYVSFLRGETSLPTEPFLVYQTTKKLNSLEIMPDSCVPCYNGKGYTCILTDRK